MKEMLLQRNTRCEHSIGSVKQYVLSNVQAEGSHLCFRKVVKLQPQSQGLILLYFPMGFQIAYWFPQPFMMLRKQHFKSLQDLLVFPYLAKPEFDI